MPRMIDLIRASAVPATLVQSAARGGLAIPSHEMLEILVYLATENKVFGEQASLTLAGLDEGFCRTAVSNPGTPKDVLRYFSSPKNFRPGLLPALIANPSVPEESLAELSVSLGRDLVETMLTTDRVFHSETILSAMAANPNLNGIQSATIDERLSLLARAHTPVAGDTEAHGQEKTVQQKRQSSDAAENSHEGVLSPEDLKKDQEADERAVAYIAEHAKEISAEAEKPFQPVGGVFEEFPPEILVAHAEPHGGPLPGQALPGQALPAETLQSGASVAGATVADAAGSAAATQMAAVNPLPNPILKRGSALQRISKLDVKGRIQLAMKGSKEDRALLIRDGTKIVALAVLDSPKISDGEVEKFAGQKNVLEAVLRAIPMKRRFMKQYNVVRNLVFNPRTPIDVSLTLMKNILVPDLKNLSGNKEVSDTVRKSALRLFKQKLVVEK